MNRPTIKTCIVFTKPSRKYPSLIIQTDFDFWYISKENPIRIGDSYSISVHVVTLDAFAVNAQIKTFVSQDRWHGVTYG